MLSIDLLSGGAAKSLVYALQARFLAQTSCDITGFPAVGMMKEQLPAGATFDAIILTGTLVGQLAADGHVLVGSKQPLGLGKTGVAVKEGAASPPLGNAHQLRPALQSATANYSPYPVKATAGIHFMKVLRELGIDTALAAALPKEFEMATVYHAAVCTKAVHPAAGPR